jgi:hypothetical protein
MTGDEKKVHERGQDSFPEPLYGAPGMDVALAGNLAVAHIITSVGKIYENKHVIVGDACYNFPLLAAEEPGPSG